MPIRRCKAVFERLDEAALDPWRRLPPAVIGDAMDRSGCMAAAIKPIGFGLRIAGQGRTVQTMVGDNSTLHAAIGLIEPGEILVADAGGALDIAVWGGVMAAAAVHRRIGGVVIDGAARDAHELREIGFPLFCRAVTPRGPHKGFGGTIDGQVSVGGVAVSPGDIIVGDDDGVVVVPLARRHEVLKRAAAQLAKEEGWLAAIRQGRTTHELLGLTPIETIEDGPAPGPGQ